MNNFVSLAQQGYFDGTPCHRLTTSPTLGVLQCGDPTGAGTGGPGYRFPNEYPTNQYRLTDPALEPPVVYPRGTLAMANAGPGTNGSQFFLVYQDSQLPPTYTVFGTVDETGLAAVDKIAAARRAGRQRRRQAHDERDRSSRSVWIRRSADSHRRRARPGIAWPRASIPPFFAGKRPIVGQSGRSNPRSAVLG